jgi:hypothetical protein
LLNILLNNEQWADIHACNNQTLMLSAKNGYITIVKSLIVDYNMKVNQDTNIMQKAKITVKYDHSRTIK